MFAAGQWHQTSAAGLLQCASTQALLYVSVLSNSEHQLKACVVGCRYGPAGGGLLRLHSTYRHDMKIYSSDEGRVQVRGCSAACCITRAAWGIAQTSALHHKRKGRGWGGMGDQEFMRVCGQQCV